VFRIEIENAAADRGEGPAWVESKIGFMRLGWTSEDEDEVNVFYEFGRGCEGFWVDDEWRQVVETGSRKWRERREDSKGLDVFGFEGVRDVDGRTSIGGCRDSSEPSSPTGSVKSVFGRWKRSSSSLEFRMPKYGK
jgi:hypothetical protein